MTVSSQTGFFRSTTPTPARGVELEAQIDAAQAALTAALAASATVSSSVASINAAASSAVDTITVASTTALATVNGASTAATSAATAAATSATAAATSATSAAASTTFSAAGTGAISRTYVSKARDVVSVEDYGAVGDGTTDDTAAIQAAVNALSPNGGTLFFGPKPYRIAGTVSVTSTTIFQGVGFQDLPADRGTARPTRGTWLIHESTTGPALQFTGANTRGSGIRNLAFFQTGHPTPGTGWAPAVRDYTVRTESSSGTFFMERVHFHNCYKGALLDYVSRPYLVDVTGQPFLEGIKLSRVYDVGSARGIHFWAYWSENTNVLDWTQQNGACLVMPSPSALMIADLFGICYKILLWLAADPDNGTHSAQVGQLYADFCAIAVQVDAANVFLKVDSIFHLGKVFGSSPSAAAPSAALLNLAGSNCHVEIGKAESNLSRRSAVNLTGTGVRLQVGQLKAQNWNYDNVAGTAMINAGTASTNSVHLGAQPWYAGGNGGPIYSGGTGVNSSIFEPVVMNHGSSSGNAVNFLRINSAISGGRVTAFPYGADTNINMVLVGKGTGYVSLADAITGDSTRADALKPLRIPSVTVANIATTYPPASYTRCMVYVSDGASNKRMAISDGTNWRWPDGAIVS